MFWIFLAMSWEEFLKYAKHLESISIKINDGWFIKCMEDIVGGSYLIKHNKQAINRQDDIHKCGFRHHFKDYDDEEEEKEDEDKSSAESNLEVLNWEYHVVYSPSYAVPVLYFNVSNSGGRRLSLEQVWENLKVSEEVLASDKWQFVTQQEHPLLLRPFYQLHPCKTAQLLAKFKSTKVNPIVTWLSSVGPLVHLVLPLQYGQDIG